MSLKEKLSRMQIQITEMRAEVGSDDATKPLRKILDMAGEVVVHALWEAVRVDDPTENSTRYGTGSNCLCPHCGQLITEVFDDVYYEGEHEDMFCPHCEAHHTIQVESVFALVNISLDDNPGVCQKCFHWEHLPGECEPHGVKCACQENTE